jgi:hypothetical protein
MRELLDKIEQSENKHINEKLDEFLTVVITECNIEYLDEGIFGKFGDWVKDKLTKPNVDPAEFAKIESNMQKAIIGKYEGVPADTVRIIIPVQTTEDLTRIAKEGPSEAMLKLGVSFGRKFGGDKKDLLKPKDYKSVGSNFKYAAIIDVKDNEFEGIQNKGSGQDPLFVLLPRSVLKKGVWGAIKLKGATFKDMIPENILGVSPDSDEKPSKKAKAGKDAEADSTAAPTAPADDTKGTDAEDAAKEDGKGPEATTEKLGKNVEEIVHNVAQMVADKKMTKSELNDIIIKLGEIRKIFAKPESSKAMNKDDAYAALGSLGYKTKEIDAIFGKIPTDVSTEEAIKQALQLLSK